MLIDALCYCYSYYNPGERDGCGFRKNVQIAGAIMKLIHFPSEKKGSHRVEELLLFQPYRVESGRSQSLGGEIKQQSYQHW